jgi:hypothetical protein
MAAYNKKIGIVTRATGVRSQSCFKCPMISGGGPYFTDDEHDRDQNKRSYYETG